MNENFGLSIDCELLAVPSQGNLGTIGTAGSQVNLALFASRNTSEHLDSMSTRVVKMHDYAQES